MTGEKSAPGRTREHERMGQRLRSKASTQFPRAGQGKARTSLSASDRTIGRLAFVIGMLRTVAGLNMTASDAAQVHPITRCTHKLLLIRILCSPFMAILNFPTDLSPIQAQSRMAAIETKGAQPHGIRQYVILKKRMGRFAG